MDLHENEKNVQHSFIHRFIFHPSTHLSMYQTCFQHMIFVCKMYEPTNEQTLHDFIINLSHVKFLMLNIGKDK
jgi:hypothetical protein